MAATPDQPRGRRPHPAPSEPDRPGRPDSTVRPDSTGRHRAAFVTGGVYGVTLLLGAVEGLLGSFEFSRGPAPAVSLACCAAILATCLLVGWTTRSLGGAVAPAVGWIVVSFVLATPDVQGSVVVTASTAGRWFLYGGAASAALAAVISFVLWVVLLPAGSDR